MPDPELYGLSALWRLYETGQGWIFLATPQEREWQALCQALEPFADLASDPRFASAQSRQRNDDALARVLAEVFRNRTAVEWEAELVAAEVGCLEVAEGSIPRATLEDAVTREAGFLTEVEHPSFGRHRRLAPLVALSLTPGEARPACLFGEHTESVLLELGYSETEIDRLEADAVVVRAK
jgi:crotonobetainyl-CoA:carnitine CoA-transferase CaiB-like acyl-CoA transferase